jgi:hypothetical protein
MQQPLVDPADSFDDLPIDDLTFEPEIQPVAAPAPTAVQEQPTTTSNVHTQGGGLAGAIARSREVKQELEKTRRQQAQAQGVRRI